MRIVDSISCLKVKIYYEDTDATGLVYHSKYLNYAERGRTEFLREIGFLQSKLYQDFKIRFVVKNLSVDYKNYANLDDNLIIMSSINQINKAKIVFLQKTLKDSIIINTIEATICCIKDNGKVARIPNELYYKIIK